MSKQTEFQFGYNATRHDTDPPAFSDPTCRPPEWDDIDRLCFRVLDYIRNLTEKVKEKSIMDLKSHRSKNTGDKFKQRPFLKAKDIPKNGLKVRVIDFRQAPEGMPYSDFLMDVANGKKEFTVGLRSESVLLDQLIDELGSKSEKYTGKNLTFVTAGPKGQYINLA